MNTYLYAFNQYVGFDKVLLLENSKDEYSPGDILQEEQNYYLVLGEEISFKELYNYPYKGKNSFSIKYKNLLSKQTIELLHRMVYERYSSYYNVVKLFLNQDIEKLISKSIKPNKKQKSYSCKIGKNIINGDGSTQTLIVFPDIRTFKNIINTQEFQGLFLYSLDTQSKKDTNRRKIKTGSEKLICTTSSEIFQNYTSLKNIYHIEPEKRYYAAQQDPRYKVDMVLKKLSEIHGATLNNIFPENLFNPL